MLLDILQSPIPTTPVILDFSYMKRPNLNQEQPIFYWYPIQSYERIVTRVEKRKVDSVQETQQSEMMDKRRLIDQTTNSIPTLSTDFNSNYNPTYETLNSFKFEFNTEIQPAPEFDNFYYIPNKFENVLYD